MLIVILLKHISTDTQDGTPLITIKSYLPVRESFGFDSQLRGETSGTAFAQCTFSHYPLIAFEQIQSE